MFFHTQFDECFHTKGRKNSAGVGIDPDFDAKVTQALPHSLLSSDTLFTGKVGISREVFEDR